MDLEFEADHDGEHKTWTLSGQDSNLHILVMPGDPESDIKQSIFMQVAITDDPFHRPQINKEKLRFKEHELTTYRYTVAWDDEASLETWAVELPPKLEKSRVLMFGMYFDDDGKMTDECAKLKKYVLESLTF